MKVVGVSWWCSHDKSISPFSTKIRLKSNFEVRIHCDPSSFPFIQHMLLFFFLMPWSWRFDASWSCTLLSVSTFASFVLLLSLIPRHPSNPSSLLVWKMWFHRPKLEKVHSSKFPEDSDKNVRDLFFSSSSQDNVNVGMKNFSENMQMRGVVNSWTHYICVFELMSD